MLAGTAPSINTTSINFVENTQNFPYAKDGSPNGTLIGHINVSDVDGDYTAGTLAIANNSNPDPSGNGTKAFILSNDNLFVNDPADFNIERLSQVTIQVKATDAANNSTTATVTVNLFNADDAPVIPEYRFGQTLYTYYNAPTNSNISQTINVLQVNENSNNGALIGNVSAFDDDNNTLTYSFPSAVPGFTPANPAISIDPFTGAIRVADTTFFDYEALRTANLGEGNMGEGGLSGFSDVVLRVKVRATESGNTNVFSQIDNDGNPATTGDITDSYVYIRVRDVSENPPDVSKATKTLTVTENSTQFTQLGYFDLIDPANDPVNGGPNFLAGPPARPKTGLDPFEPQQTHSFAIVGGNSYTDPITSIVYNNIFAIDSTTGAVTVNNAVQSGVNTLNFESIKQFNLQIKVTDQNPLGAVQTVNPESTVATLHIDLTDVNERSAITDGQVFTIPENSQNGVVVGTVVATDPDLQKPNGLGSLVYSIISGNQATINGTPYTGIFVIDPATGTITVNNTTGQANAAVLNYANQSTFALTIQVVDRGDMSTSANKVVAVNLTKVNTIAPTMTNGSATINEESNAGTLVGQIVTNNNGDSDSVTGYTITAVNGISTVTTPSNTFTIDQATGRLYVNDPTLLDYNTHPQFVLTIKVTDNGAPPLSSTGTFTVNLLNVNDPIQMQPQTFTVAENSIAGTVVGPIFTTDKDYPAPNPQLGRTFAIISGNTNNTFSVDNNGNITVADPTFLNYEVNPSYSLFVNVTDGGQPATTAGAIMTINLLNRNDTPVINPQTFTVPEHSLAGTVVNTVAATDEDVGQVLTYSIVSGNTLVVNGNLVNVFQINPSTGLITVTDPGLIDFVNNPTFNLVVQVADNGIPSATASANVTINLTDRANQPNITAVTTSLAENSPANTVVVPSLTVVGDVGPYVYSIMSGNAGNTFSINPTTGQIKVSDPTALDFETNQQFSLQVLVVDNQIPKAGDTQTITINLTNVNEAPVLSGLEVAALNATENVATPVSTAIVPTDVDSLNAQGATIQISTNFVPVEDVLSFTNTANITGSFNPVNGMLTLSGTDTLANYQAAIRSVKYTDTVDNPTNSTRTLSFQITDDGGLPSAIVTRNLNVVPVNDPPVLASALSTLAYTEATGAKSINPMITVNDPDNTTLAAATVTVTGFVPGEDVIGFTANPATMGNISAVSNTGGVLTLASSGSTATLAQWQVALRSVTYTNTSASPTVAARTVAFVVDDGSAVNHASSAQTTTINITVVNTPPSLNSLEPAPLAPVENIATPVTAAIVATDPDSVNASGATIQITGGYQLGEDVLSFVNTGTITGTWTAANGTLTLSGADTFANYQTALRNVKYTDNLDNPTNGTRTLTFLITDDSAATSAAVTRDLNVVPVNDPPVLASAVSTLAYTEATGAMAINPMVTVNDPDSSTLASAVVTLGIFVPGEDVVSFASNIATMGNISLVSNTNGVLTLASVGQTATLAQWQAALRAVTYTNLSTTPTTAARTVNFQVDDGAGVNHASNVFATTINVTPVNTAPTLSGIESTPLSATENIATPLTSALLATDPDSVNAQSATIKITGNYLSTEDVLAFATIGAISGSWNSATGTLTLSGTDTIANYQAALRTVTYVDTSDAPNLSTRTVSFTFNDDGTAGGLPSNTVSRSISITPVNDPPVLSAIEGTTLASTENIPIAITSALVVSDPDSANLQGATVKITGNYLSTEDSLAFTNTANITGSWDSVTGTLTLSGTDTLANYQAALRSVTYVDSSNSPSILTRTVSFTITDDGALPSNTLTRNISLAPVNDPPVLSAIEVPPLAVNENIPTAITATLAVSDPDSTNIQGATIKITGNYLSTEDSLAFTNTANISGVWNSATATLTLTGSDTLANYQAALRTVTYNDSADAPNTLIRTVSFTITDTGALPSNTVTRNINVNPINDPPVLAAIEGSSLAYVENAVTTVTATLVATDPDSTNASSATIQITGAYLSTQDSLVFTNTANITGSWNSATGTMTLSGSDTFANYQAAIRAVKYSNSSDSPNVTPRTVSFTITDSAGLPSNTLTRGITITPVNDPPALVALETSAATYTENVNTFANATVTAAIVATDPDSLNLQGATVQITAHYINGQDQLNFTNTANISGVWNAATATLTLSGVDSLANYRAAIRTVTYQNLSHNPNTTARTVTFQVTDTSGAPSATVSRNINVVPVNNPPALASSLTNLAYTEGTGAKAINPLITVSDVDSTTLSNATVTITNFDAAEDVLGFVPNAATMGNISVVTNSNGVLNLTSVGGTATLAQWQAAFRAVTYTNTSGDLAPPSRTVTFVADDGSGVNNIGNTLTTGINITPIFPPVLSVTSNKTYVEQGPAVFINAAITVGDPGTATLASATVKITNFVSGQDVIDFVPNGATMGNIGIQSNLNGVLILTSSGSTATLAQWQAALRAVTYADTSHNPTLTTRTVTFQVDNGKTVNHASNVLSSSVSLSPVNDAPVLSGIESSPLSYTELSPNVHITGSIVASDVDSANLSGATIKIIGSYTSNQDRLQFTNTSNIAGVFDSSTGTLTLTGLDTVANYQAALRSIVYFNTSNNPVTFTRSVQFTVVDNGGLSSNSVTRNMTITPVNNAPSLTGIETSPLQYIENTVPNYSTNNTTAVSATILAGDPDSVNMSGAKIQITGNYQSNQDLLVFTNTAKITGSWDAVTGTLTLTGADTLANYTAALRSVAYRNLQDAPATFTRTVAYTITDDMGLPSNTVTRLVTVTAVNDPPLLTMVDTGALAYTENATTVIAPSILAADADSDNLKSATIQITGQYVNGKDLLVFTNTANITGSWNALTGTLTLTGIDSVSNYRTALRSVAFFNQHDGTTAATRTVSFTVTDQAGLTGNTVTRNVSITTVNDAAILSGIETTPHVYKANDQYTPATPITATLVVTDYDSTNLSGATVQITGAYSSGHDRLGFSASGTNITGSFNTTTGILTLTGTDTVANYQAALRSVTYSAVNGSPGTATRTVSFQVTDSTNLKSNSVTRFVTIAATNAPPSISLNSAGPLDYTEGDPATVIAPATTVADVDSPNLQNATIKITGNYQPGQDQLQFASIGNIIFAGFSSTTGTLTISGSGTLLQYEAALQTVKYVNTSSNPSTATRTISFVVSDGLVSSNVATQTVTVAPVDNAPVLATNASGPLAYKPANGIVAITPGMSVTDSDSTNLTGATITIVSSYQRGNDTLSFTAIGNITGSFNAATGVLTLTGSDTLANYRTALQSITYKFSNGTAITSTKTVSFTVSDGTKLSAPVSRSINVSP